MPLSDPHGDTFVNSDYLTDALGVRSIVRPYWRINSRELIALVPLFLQNWDAPSFCQSFPTCDRSPPSSLHFFRDSLLVRRQLREG